MQLKADQLGAHLASGRLAPLYVLTGDEPLQIKESGDAIRQRARDLGYSVREVIEAGKGFDWNSLAAAADTLSLFGDLRLLDLRVPDGKPGRDGGRALAEYAANPPPDALLLITLPRLDNQQMLAKWFKALEKRGVVLRIWPVDAGALVPWLNKRAMALGVDLDQDALRFVAAQTEGNLLAAAQELEKLLLLHGSGKVSLEQTMACVGGSARYNVFELVDSALAGPASRALRILDGLRGEGTAAPIVLWALARELRVLESLANTNENGGNPRQAFAAHKVWKNREALLTRHARRQGAADWRKLIRLCALADLVIKGQEVGDPWTLLEDVVFGMAAGRLAVKITA